MKKLSRILVVTLRVTLITMITSFIAVEILMRFLTTTTPDGAIFYRGMAIRPFVIPVDNIASDVERYLENPDASQFQYDEQLGWVFPRDFETSQVTTNSIGVRSRVEYDIEPSDDVTRIAIFGDSFVAGGEVGDTDALPLLLEEALNACGASVEVMNFGMFGYGMDQAFLRWQVQGRQYNPDIVVMGFQPENLNRNVNLARPLAVRSGLPFTKPRFIITENGDMQLINSPTVPVEDLVELYTNFDSWELADYEWHYDERYRSHPTDISMIYRVIDARQNVELRSRLRLSPEDERVQVGYAIIEQFAADAVAEGSEFVVLHLPNQPELRYRNARGQFGYQFMLDELSIDYNVIPSEDVFTSIDVADWQPNLHYSPAANERMATFAANWLDQTLDSITCDNA